MLRHRVRVLTAVSRSWTITGLFLAAILAGSLVGALDPEAGTALGSAVDPAILLLIGLLVFTVRVDSLAALKRAPRTVVLALALNFAVVPVVAFALTSVLVPSHALRLGVLIYCLFPCTDWFLGFTRMAGGDTTTGAALIPIQMVLQLLLYPVWLALFAGQQVAPPLDVIVPTLWTWFAVPAGVALGLRVLVQLGARPPLRGRLTRAADRTVSIVIAVIILGLFAAHVDTILSDPAAFGGVLMVVFLFFVVMWAVGEVVARAFRLDEPTHALLTMTTSARNAPLMLAITTVALPGQPVVSAAIVLGMLIEFPHLTVLTQVLRRRAARAVPVVARSASA